MSQRIKMTPLERAKQFAPFAALRGHGAELDKVSRPLPQKRELTEEEAAILNRRLLAKVKGDPVALILFDGVEYRRVEGSFRRLDPTLRLLWVDEEAIPLDQLLWLNR